MDDTTGRLERSGRYANCILSYEANAAGVTPNQVLDELISNVAVAKGRRGT